MKNENKTKKAVDESGRKGNSQSYEKAVDEVKHELQTPPTREQVRVWVERDLSAASYSIGAILRHPKLLDLIAQEMFENAQKSPAQIMAEQAEKYKPNAQA